MIEHLLTALANSIAIIGLWKAASPGMIGEKVREKIEERAGCWWSKPIISCHVCMSSLWAVIPYALVVDPLRALPHGFLVAGMTYLLIQASTGAGEIADTLNEKL